jgi:dTMP kinase
MATGTIQGVTPRLVSFEGLDGVGKTTHVQLLVNRLHTLNIDVSTYREPGGTPLGERLRELIQAGLAQAALSELLLFATARAELVETRVKPDLAAGKLVILDRFSDSTRAYQGALGAPPRLLDSVCQLASAGLEPAMTIWLDLDPVSAFQRRYPLNGVIAGLEREAPDAIERRDLEYFTRVQAGYALLHEENPDRILKIDASQSLADVEDQIAQEVFRRFMPEMLNSSEEARQ